MPFQPTIPDYEFRIKAIDSHTMGEPTRIIYDGFPELSGKTMMEKKQDLMARWGCLRTALMLEPRGHRNMFGALLTEPVHPEADLGVIFLDNSGCLNMCGHGSIGVCAMAVDTGLVKAEGPYAHVCLDTPSGLIHAKVRVEQGMSQEVTIENVPAFLYSVNQAVTLPGGQEVRFDISFGGSFFALVDADTLGLALTADHVDELVRLGMTLLRRVNEGYTIQHPELDIHTVDLVEFYSRTAAPGADMRNCIVFGDSQIDRSPCGTGTSAKLAALYAKGQLGLHEPFIYESITGSRFQGEALREVNVGPYAGIVPQITGRAYITGASQWLLRADDPLKYGFLLD
ncbi:MAG: proline racemase family protein [Faecousia sp.]